MEDLIKALQIFAKYNNSYAPIICEHDKMHVDVDPRRVSAKDMEALAELSFYPDDYADNFSSNRFGSC